MPFLFTCPHCGVRTHIPQSFVGQSGPCHSCGKTVEIRPPARDEVTDLSPSKSSMGVMIALTLGVLAMIIAAAGGTLLVSSSGLRNNNQTQRLSRSKANMQQIVVALQAYHGANGSFPPPYSVDANGNPLHSWRVLLLPYLGQEGAQIYGELKLEEPWDSEHNLTVAAAMPQIYRSPAEPTNVYSNVSSYFVVVGPQTMFPGPGKSAGTNDAVDPPSETLLVVESTPKNRIWTEPVEFDVSRMRFELNTFAGSDISGPHPGGVVVGLADGSAYFLPEDTPPESFEAMTTRSGSDAAPPEL